MKFSIIRNRRDNSGTTVQAIDANDLIVKQMSDYECNIVGRFREIALTLDTPENWHHYHRMARVCPATQFYRSKAGEIKFRCYNGVSVVTISGLNGYVELEKAKKQASLLPQVMSAFIGADGCSVVVLTVSTLPDGSLPKDEEQALLFTTKAYITSVQCLQPTLDYAIDIKEPALDTSFLMTVDSKPYYNPSAIPFIIEQPSAVDVKQLMQGNAVGKVLEKMPPCPDTFVTYRKVFNSVFHRAMNETGWTGTGNDDNLINTTAEMCAKVMLPSEETVFRLHTYFKEHDIRDIRSTVQNVYNKNKGVSKTHCFTKHQLVAYRLSEFLNRRYDIRFNEVLQMTEFRERHSIQFVYRELNRRELNSIHHEALLEGIEPSFGEIDGIVHSTHTRLYNPIEDYLSKLPCWDGKDHIGKLADSIPTDNPNWKRLFRQWFLSMVAHWMNDDEVHANCTAPILIGDQGFRKSTFCRQLLPPELQMFYTDSIDFRSKTEAERMLSRFMLINIDEFDQLSEKQFAYVKHLFQKPASNIRRMYSESIGMQRRYASFIATTNCDEILRDPTGSRRYLCVQITGPIHTDQSINYQQLYSQAVSIINSGERYWINDEDEALIRESNKAFEVQHPLEQLFLTAFEPVEAANKSDATWMRSTEIMEILQTLPSFNRKTDNNLWKLGKVLNKLKMKKRRSASGRQYLTVRRIS